MTRPLPEPVTVGLDEHPAVVAWAEVSEHFAVPTAVTTLKNRKSSVYRLHGVGAGGSNVVAKRCSRGSSLRERAVYESVLPRLPILSLAYYGHFDGPGDKNSWLFVEDAGDEVYNEVEKVDFIHWLGELHASSAGVLEGVKLRQIGPDHYLEHVRAGQKRIIASLTLDHFTEEEIEVLHRTLALCNYMERRWDELRPPCEEVPHTLVHGDLSSKNVRLRRSSSGVHFFALDWEMAGIGAPAPDLGTVSYGLSYGGTLPLEAYFSVVSKAWGSTREQIERLANAGLVFRLAASIDWATEGLCCLAGRRKIRKLPSCEKYLLVAFTQLGWEY